MSVTYASFIMAFPEFSSATSYPQGQIEFWLGLAPDALTGIYRRAKPGMVDLATMLFVAHNVVLSTRDAKAVISGVPGASSGQMTSKAVDKVSVTYDVSSTSVAGAEVWNSTTYGQRLYKMIKAYATGPIYVVGSRVVG